MIPKSARGKLHSGKVCQMQDAGLILDVREISGPRDLPLVFAVSNSQSASFRLDFP
jgi:hypothetical protein